METKSAEFLYMMFILPSLFSLTLVGEGLYKIAKHEEGFFTFVLGLFFLVAIAFSYFFLFSK
jgi:hypothetical protein